MSFEVTVNIPALDRLVDALNNGASMPAKPAAKPATTKAKEDTAVATKAKVKEEAPADADSDVPSGDELKSAALSLSGKNGRDALAAALKDHGATAGLSTLPDDQKAAFVAHCEAAVA